MSGSKLKLPQVFPQHYPFIPTELFEQLDKNTTTVPLVAWTQLKWAVESYPGNLFAPDGAQGTTNTEKTVKRHALALTKDLLMLPSRRGLLQNSQLLSLRTKILKVIEKGGNPLNFKFWDQFGEAGVLMDDNIESAGAEELLHVKLVTVQRRSEHIKHLIKLFGTSLRKDFGVKAKDGTVKLDPAVQDRLLDLYKVSLAIIYMTDFISFRPVKTSANSTTE